MIIFGDCFIEHHQGAEEFDMAECMYMGGGIAQDEIGSEGFSPSLARNMRHTTFEFFIKLKCQGRFSDEMMVNRYDFSPRCSRNEMINNKPS